MVRRANHARMPTSLFASAPGLNQVYLAFLLAKPHACSKETVQRRNLCRASAFVGPAVQNSLGYLGDARPAAVWGYRQVSPLRLYKGDRKPQRDESPGLSGQQWERSVASLW